MEDTWILVYERVSARQKTKYQARICRLSRAIVASLKGDRKRRVETAGGKFPWGGPANATGGTEKT